MPSLHRLLCLILFAGAAFACGSGTQNADELPKARVERGTFELVLEEIGVVDATRVVSVLAPYRGKLISLAETGQTVAEGDVILVMENTQEIKDLQDQLDELKTVRSELEASVESLTIAIRSGTLDTDLAEAELAFERVRLQEINTRLAETAVLLEKDVVPAEDLREAESDVVNSRYQTLGSDFSLRTGALTSETNRTATLNDIERQALRGQRARREVDEAQERIDSSRLKAPVAGMFIRTKRWQWSQNAMVEAKPGDSVRGGQEIGRIPDLSTLILKSQIPEGNVAQVRVGAPVRIAFDAYDGLKLTGKVTMIGKVAIERETSAAGALVQTEGYSGQKVFETEIAFDEPDPRIKPGITASVSIQLDRHEDVLTIPVEAVAWRDGKAVVGVLDGNGGWQEREVELGARNSRRVIVTKGVQEGELLLGRWDSVPSVEHRPTAG
ncbi:MAG: HlyD family secretion protein [Candidatus Sumerlaeota bacterium]|nr:HlyD family secretion protein [Candidatus Sumerlaeota bacterium]